MGEGLREADFVVIAVPTNYNPGENFFDCSAVEAVIKAADRQENPMMVTKSPVPMGYTESVCRERLLYRQEQMNYEMRRKIF